MGKFSDIDIGLCRKCGKHPINEAEDELCAECYADYSDYLTDKARDDEIDRQIDDAIERDYELKKEETK